MKMSKENKKQAIQAEAQEHLTYINQNITNPSQLTKYIYDTIQNIPLRLHSNTLSSVIINIKALFSAISNLELPDDFLMTINVNKKLFITSAETLEIPHDDHYDPSKYWLIPLTYHVKLIGQVIKLLKEKQISDIEKKIAYAFKVILFKTFEITNFTIRLQNFPLGILSPELLYLVKSITSLLLANLNLLTPTMDKSTVSLQ